MIIMPKPEMPNYQTLSKRPNTLFCFTVPVLLDIVKNYISDDQAGFKKGQNTTEPELESKTYVIADFESKIEAPTIFIDILAAHDIV